MKRSFYTALLCSIITMLSVSCTEKANNDQALLNRIDSLTRLTSIQQYELNNMEGFITSLAQTMDSIDMQEQILTGKQSVEYKGKRNRQQIKDNLKRFKETLQRQKERIAQLEEQLAVRNDSVSARMRQIVAYYKKEIEAKDKTIASLQTTIERKNMDISQLQGHVDHLVTTNQAQEQIIQEQDVTLKEQTMMLNKAYIKIGTKKELKAQGFLTGGLFSKKKLDPAKLRSENFQEVDMRTVNDLIVHSSGPKILTQMPTSSYRFVNNGNGTYTLHILSPGDFWSISNFLVIQL